MTALLVIITVASTVFLLLIAYMEWVGLTSLFSTGPRRRYACGHFKVHGVPGDPTHCWNCRHPRAAHVLHEAAHPLQHSH